MMQFFSRNDCSGRTMLSHHPGVHLIYSFPQTNVRDKDRHLEYELQVAAGGFQYLTDVLEHLFGLLFNLGLGVLSRLMPQMQVFFVGMPLSIMVGFLILLLVIGAMMMTFLDSVETVLRVLAPRS